MLSASTCIPAHELIERSCILRSQGSIPRLKKDTVCPVRIENCKDLCCRPVVVDEIASPGPDRIINRSSRENGILPCGFPGLWCIRNRSLVDNDPEEVVSLSRICSIWCHAVIKGDSKIIIICFLDSLLPGSVGKKPCQVVLRS